MRLSTDLTRRETLSDPWSGSRRFFHSTPRIPPPTSEVELGVETMVRGCSSLLRHLLSRERLDPIGLLRRLHCRTLSSAESRRRSTTRAPESRLALRDSSSMNDSAPSAGAHTTPPRHASISRHLWDS